MSFALNPIFSPPIAVNAGLNSFKRVYWVMFLTVPSFMTEHMGVSRFSPRRIRLLWTKAEADITGERNGSTVASCVFIFIFRRSFSLKKLVTPLGPGKSLGCSTLSLRSGFPKNLCFGFLSAVSSYLHLLHLSTHIISLWRRIQGCRGLLLIDLCQ